MPTQLLTGRQMPKAELGGELDWYAVVVSAPWQGFCPDLSPQLGGFTAFYDSQGLVNRDGTLTLDSGWARLDDTDSVELPLGGEWDNPGPANFPLAPAGAGYEQPVLLISEMFRADGQEQLRNVFVATGLSVVTITAPDPLPWTATCGFCWYLDETDWLNVPYNILAPVPDGGGDPAKPDGLDSLRSDPFDWAPYPLGGTQVGGLGVRPGLVCFTNKVNEVYVWDVGDVTGGIPTPPGAYCSAFGTALGGEEEDQFYAKSVELYDDRLCFLNTREENEERYRRFRWTSLTPNAYAPFVAGITGVGSGFMDLDEFNGEGLRVLKFEDRAALYFTDGVAIVNRTFNTTNPFNRQYLTKERGLLGTFAVTRMDGDRHVGLFSDGWFVLNSNGLWQELGAVSVGSGQVYKWKRRFYTILDLNRRNQIVINYDSGTKRIRIGFPVTEPEGGSAVWVYDMATDTVWPDDPYTVTIWGDADALIVEALPWNDPLFTGETWPEGTGRWIDYAATYGTKVSLHGSEDGLVFVHSELLAQRDGEDAEWRFQSHRQDYGNPSVMKTGDWIAVRHGTLRDDSNIAVGFVNEEGTEVTQNINLHVDEPGLTSTSTIHPVLAGDVLGLIGVGVGMVELYAFQPAIRGGYPPAKDPLP